MGEPDGGIRLGIETAVAQILSVEGDVAGAGFLVDGSVVVTCAHVVRASGYGPGGRLLLVFPRAPGAPHLEGEVLVGPWRSPEDEDVAVIRLSRLPVGVPALALGSAVGCRGHQVRSFGFPDQAPDGGHFGYGTAGDLLTATPVGGSLLQLTGANDLTTGFSGGPVIDEVSGLAIGMVTSIAGSDRHLRGQGIAYATPTQTLRQVWPDLTERGMRPYLGLESFTAHDASLFHGRGAAVERVLTALTEQRRVLLLLGPSGAGKSSLIEAGVLPALASGALPGSDRWLPVLVRRPGADLSGALERAGLSGVGTEGIVRAVERRLATDPGHEHLVLVIDQFEEIFAPPTDLPAPANRPNTPAPLLDSLSDATAQIAAAIGSHAEVSVVLVMRDDFYPHLASRAPGLLEAAAPGLLNVPATLSRQDLRAIIEKPALTAGARFEEGLPERIAADVLASDRHGIRIRRAPVTLLAPLELALSQLWERREDGYLTHAAYEQIGQVTGSLTTWCNTAVNELLPPQQAIAQRILTALVRPADDAHHVPATRQQVPLHVLRDLAADAPYATPTRRPDREATDEVLSALTRHRIVTTHTPQAGDTPGPPTAELIHDTLTRDWGELRAWVAQDHQFHNWLRRAEEQRTRWTPQEDAADLLHGVDLTEGLAWAEQRGLPGSTARFLDISQHTQQRAIRRARRLNIFLAGALVIAVIAAGLAFWQQQTAVTAQRTAVTAQQQAQSRQLAAQSTALINTDPDLASLLAVQAYRRSPTDEATASLYAAAALPLRQRLTGHTEDVWAVAFSPDGRTLATGSADTTVRLWDVATRKTRATLTGHTDGAATVVFSPDGRTLATSATDDKVRLWDVATGKRRATLTGHAGDVETVVFSPDGRTLATSSADNAVRLWDIATRKTRAILTGFTYGAASVAFSPDGRTLATSGVSDDRVLLWDVATGKRRASLTGHGHDEGESALAFSPDGRTLATTSATDHKVRLWDVATGKRRAAFASHADDVDTVMFSPDGHTLASSSINDNAVRLWDTATRKRRATLTGHTDGVWAVAFNPDGHTLAVGSGNKTAWLWDVATGKRRATLTGHTEDVEAVAFSPDGRTLATGSADNTVRLWDVATETGRATLTAPANAGWLTFVMLSPDGRTLATSSLDDRVRLWDVATGNGRATLPRHTGGVTTVVFSPDGGTLATASADNTAWLWDVATGKRRATLTGHTEDVEAMVFSPDGRTLATGSADNTARMWNTATGERRAILTGHTGRVDTVVFSPDSATLATSSTSDDRVWLWDVATGKSRATLTGHTEGVWAMVFSPDGRTLATSSINDSTVRLWDTATGKRRATLAGHTGGVTTAVFSPDGRTLATSSDDATARLWNVATGKKQAVLTGHTDEVYSAVFSPDGGTLATASADNTARMWDTATGESRATLVGQIGDVEAVVFSPDGRTLATGAVDNTVRLWDVATGSRRATLTGDPGFSSVVVFSPDGRTLATSSLESDTVRLWNVALPDQAGTIKKLCLAVGRDLTKGERAAYLPDLSPSPVCSSHA
ncbi:nSTAND1 domain-containing NTPase [Streptomyces canus]|uniref:nSTAND1 domain-containing NTPase n=1 Tax=Streptomyces canus TaxID=58343 RepID=UPI0033BAFE17